MGSELNRRLCERVESVLDRLRPALVADGGNLELVGVDDHGVVRVEFQGACAACPAQIATLRFGVEATLLREVPGVTAVVPVAPPPAGPEAAR